MGISGVNAASGAISGAFAASGICLAASVGINAALGGGTYIAEHVIKGKKMNLTEGIISVGAGAIGGLIGGKGADGQGLRTAWKYAKDGIAREARRCFKKYAMKRTAQYVAQKAAIKTTVAIAIGRYATSTVANTYLQNRMNKIRRDFA